MECQRVTYLINNVFCLNLCGLAVFVKYFDTFVVGSMHLFNVIISLCSGGFIQEWPIGTLLQVPRLALASYLTMVHLR